MSQPAKFTVATDVQVYFCNPHSPWQRGSNENTNGPPRQYFPHGTHSTTIDADRQQKVDASLNRRPKKTLDGRSPAEA